MHGCVNKWMDNAWVDGDMWMHECMGGWVSGWMDEMDERTGG